MQGTVLSDAIRRAEAQFGDELAAVEGDTRLTYRQLASRIRRLAGALEQLGVGRGDRVAVLMQNGTRYLETYFAIPGMGAVIVPMNNRLATAEHRAILDDAGASVLIVDEAHRAIGNELAAAVKEVVVAPDGYEDLLAQAPEHPLGVDLDDTDLAGLFYTGGTTGRAKGVMLTHRNLVVNSFHLAMAVRYSATDVYLHAAPMFHLADGASTYILTWMGGRHVFLPSFDPSTVLATIQSEAVTCVVLVPTMIDMVASHSAVATTDLSSLRLVLHGGAPIASGLLRRAIDALGCSFSQAYGMTEAAPLLTLLEHEEDLVDDPRLRSAGREVIGVTVTVRRPDGTECSPGEIGEIVARGPNFMPGYWNNPAATDEAIRDGWYWSGDLAYMDDDSYLYIVDRAKDMIISGGENIYSVEVEDAVAAHPAVREVAVIGVPDDTWGERVHAVVALNDGATLTVDELRAFCKQRIAGYKAPRSIEIVDALPKSGAGKVIKQGLRASHWAGHERAVH